MLINLYFLSQAQDRAHRIGQRNEVRVFRLITTSPIEEKILARATDKKNLNSLAVEAGQFNKGMKSMYTKMFTNMYVYARTYTFTHMHTCIHTGAANSGSAADDKKELMQSLLKEWSESAEAEVEGGDGGIYDDNDVPDDEQLNQLMAIHESDLQTYREMDALREATRLQEWKDR